MAIATYDSGCRTNTIHRNDNYYFPRINCSRQERATGANRSNKDYRPRQQGWEKNKKQRGGYKNKNELKGIKNNKSRTKRNGTTSNRTVSYTATANRIENDETNKTLVVWYQQETKRRNRTESKQDETFETEIKTMYDLQGWDPEHEELRATTKEDTKRKKKNRKKNQNHTQLNRIEAEQQTEPKRREDSNDESKIL